jgi:C_GCAxxG_C_C family probable redox protein
MQMDKDETLEEVYRRAFEYEREKGGCSQCVMAALKEVVGVGSKDVFKAGDALAGGAAITGNGTCGALSGGIMATSCAFGRDYDNFVEYSDFTTFEIAKKLYDKFVEEYGSCICKDVQQKIMGRSFNLWDPDDYAEFIRAGGHKDKCPDVVGKTARWAAEIILEQGAKP